MINMTYVKENHVSLRKMIDELNLELEPIDYEKFDKEGGIVVHLYENYDLVNPWKMSKMAEELWEEFTDEEKEDYGWEIGELEQEMTYDDYQYFKIPKEQVKIWDKYTEKTIFKHDEKDEYIIGFGHFGIAWNMIGTDMTKEELIAIKKQ